MAIATTPPGRPRPLPVRIVIWFEDGSSMEENFSIVGLGVRGDDLLRFVAKYLRERCELMVRTWENAR